MSESASTHVTVLFYCPQARRLVRFLSLGYELRCSLCTIPVADIIQTGTASLAAAQTIIWFSLISSLQASTVHASSEYWSLLVLQATRIQCRAMCLQ